MTGFSFLVRWKKSLTHPSVRGPIGMALGIISVLLVAGCANQVPELVAQEPVEVSLTVDGHKQKFSTLASNVREFLENTETTVGDSDLVDPPLFTPISDGIEVTIVRVTESVEILERSIPFQRKTVRNESMNADSSPIIIQGGKPGLQEITVRIIYHDGLESSRQETQVSVVEAAQDEVVMIGVGAGPGTVDFEGILAIINGGNSVVLRGSSTVPEQLRTGDDLDHRVFRLSPTGSHLLYTRATTDTERFNTLWIISTERGASPRSLEIDNVLWADWDPSRIGEQQVAYTTGQPTELLPGWEANNDLWLGDVPESSSNDFEPVQVIESYPATYGWWGGNYAWSPTGRFIAYSFADEVGVIDTEAENEGEERQQLHAFTEFNTRADWVWVPSLTWSPDGEFVAFTSHGGGDPDSSSFDTWVSHVDSGYSSPFVEQTGIWSHPHWSPLTNSPFSREQPVSQIAFLKAINPLDSQRSSYTLWLMDRDGSNGRQLFPPAGENSRFPRDQQFMAWGPSGRELAFIYNSSLYLYDLDTGESQRITQDDNVVSNPSWAPYGSAISMPSRPVEPSIESTPRIPRGGIQP